MGKKGSDMDTFKKFNCDDTQAKEWDGKGNVYDWFTGTQVYEQLGGEFALVAAYGLPSNEEHKAIVDQLRYELGVPGSVWKRDTGEFYIVNANGTQYGRMIPVYWLESVCYIGPNPNQMGQRREFIRVLGSSPNKNMSGETINSTDWVWLGTTDNWDKYGLGPISARDCAKIVSDETSRQCVPDMIQPGNEFFVIKPPE